LPWDARLISTALISYEAALPPMGWPNWVLSNHDKPRIASRVGAEQAFVAAMLLLTLRGTITLYYGDELGMRDVAVPLYKVVDPRGLNMPDKNLGRDPARSPMQWDATLNAGFTSAEPWLPVDRLATKVNVAMQKNDPASLLSLHRRIIALRSREPALSRGEFVPVYADTQLLSFLRQHQNAPRFLIVLNLTHRPCYFKPGTDEYHGTIIICTAPELEGHVFEDGFALEGDQGMIVQLDE
jgi:alpha-glucosidase